MKHLLTATLILLACACSKPDMQENREALDHTKGEWTHDQTEKAIDIYLDVLRQQEALIDKEADLLKSLNYFDENRCSRDVLNARKNEIQAARTRIRQKQDSLLNLSK